MEFSVVWFELRTPDTSGIMKLSNQATETVEMTGHVQGKLVKLLTLILVILLRRYRLTGSPQNKALMGLLL